MNFALIGPTGAGKGTVATTLSKELDLEHLSTGDLFRENLGAKTALGLLARKYMDRGELVPDEVVEAMIEERVRKGQPGRGVLFDGFPRTEYQAKFLDELFGQLNQRLGGALLLNISDAELLQRLRGRLVCRLCQTPFHASIRPPSKQGICDACGGELMRRHDDDPDLVLARVGVFRRSVGSVMEFYRQSGRLAIVDVSGSSDEVHQAVLAAIGRLRRPESSSPGAAPILRLPDWHRPLELPLAEAAHAGLGLVLLGGPGSGKGTQAETLSRELGLPHVATGDLFRENLRQLTDLGKLAKTYMDRGELVPDEITEAMVKERLARPDTEVGFILDGFPRTLPQAEALKDIMTQLRRRLVGVLCINVSDNEIVHRLSGRLICRQCQAPYHLQFKPPRQPGHCDTCSGELYQRDDDNPTTVRARLKTFHAQTEPLIEYYRRAGLLGEINGEGGVKAVTALTLNVAQNLKNR